MVAFQGFSLGPKKGCRNKPCSGPDNGDTKRRIAILSHRIRSGGIGLLVSWRTVMRQQPMALHARRSLIPKPSFRRATAFRL
ncbi:hypothetical protein, partial [Mesorhizobium sp. M0244]|uniref:hypothetical protein n=1 Tax=Mesorhizobium sp. M0244 TaxID=2956926 RepID=UPI0033391580